VKYPISALLALVLVVLPKAAAAAPIIVDFESPEDFALVGAGIPGLTFSNATVLTAGISLNECEFPPVSGSKVVLDDAWSTTSCVWITKLDRPKPPRYASDIKH